MSDHPLDGHLFGPGQPCFGCAPDHPLGFRLAFERDGDEIVTRFTPDDRYQGPPGIMHGGLVGTLADEVGAWSLIGLLGKFGFTASFEAKFLGPVRIGVPLEARGRIVKDHRRLVDVEVTVRQDDLPRYRSGLRFAVLDRGGAERMLGREIPEEWLRFCR
jgi:acyl-coenzyme A thioesterase PaaI-like protein